jgi:carboxymethylenebutenolidase
MTHKTEQVSIPVSGQTYAGYLALPEHPGPRPGVVVIQEIFGVNSHIRSIADRLAQAGYVALAPDLFWRVRPGIELGYQAEDIAQGMAVRGQINNEDSLLDLKAAFGLLAARPETKGKKLAVMGFCWGGTMAYLAACRLAPACTVSYYGGGIVNLLGEADAIQGPILFHFGELDKGIPIAAVDQIQTEMRKKKDATVFRYPGAEHGFHCDQRASYHPASAATAWQRTLDFFGKHLG